MDEAFPPNKTLDRAQEPAPAAEPPAGQVPPRRLRVAWIAGRESLDYLGRTLQPLAIGLIDEMVDVVVICPAGADAGPLPAPPLEMVRHGPLRRWLFRTRAEEALVAEIRSRKVDLLHAVDAEAAGLTRRLARATGLKYTICACSLGDGRRLGTLDEQAAAVLAASEPIRNDLAEHRVAAPERIHLLRPGVYQVRHATCFDTPQRSISIVAGGGLDDARAWEAVMKAFGELHARKYDCVYFVMGRGRAEKRLRALGNKLGLQHDLTFIDQQPMSQLPGILKAADIYISPVPSRRIDIQALLAMAAGDPVLAAGDGATDFLIDGSTAMLFRAGSAAELTVKLAALLDDHAYARSLAERALEYLRTHHTAGDMVAAMTRIYRQAAEKKA